MKDLNTIKRKIMNPNVKILFLPISIILVLSILIYLSVSRGYLQINQKLDELKSMQSTEGILEHKVEVLRNVQQGVLGNAETTLVVLPEDNSALFSIAQIKKFLPQDAQITKIEVSASEEDNDVRRTKIRLEADFLNIGDITPFIRQVRDAAPLTTVDGVKLSDSQGLKNAEITFFAYWSEFPEKVPPITKPVVELNDDDQKTLFTLSNYQTPEFTTLEVGQTTDRQNPFN
jgi:hypothetical protein